MKMPRQGDDEERKADLYNYRAALAFLLVMLVLIVGGVSLTAYLFSLLVRLFRYPENIPPERRRDFVEVKYKR
jgi:hypothetical protein